MSAKGTHQQAIQVLCHEVQVYWEALQGTKEEASTTHRDSASVVGGFSIVNVCTGMPFSMHTATPPPLSIVEVFNDPVGVARYFVERWLPFTIQSCFCPPPVVPQKKAVGQVISVAAEASHVGKEDC